MLVHSFTRREKVLLLLLVLVALVGLFVLFVYRPSQDKIAELAKEQEDLELAIEVCTFKQTQYNEMKAELDEIFALPADQITVMPPYDNLETLMVQFNGIFMGLEPKLSFSGTKTEEGVVTRPIDFTVEAPSYEQARAILTRLTHTGQRSLLDGLSITPADGTGNNTAERDIRQGPVKVAGTIYFYELDTQPAPAQTAAAPAGG